MASYRRSSSNAGLPAMLAATANTADYSSGSLHAVAGAGPLAGWAGAGRRGSGNVAIKRSSGNGQLPATVSESVVMDAHIPLPTDPDPDVYAADEESGWAPAAAATLPGRGSFSGHSPISSPISGRSSLHTLPANARSGGGFAGMRSPGRGLLSHSRAASFAAEASRGSYGSTAAQSGAVSVRPLPTMAHPASDMAVAASALAAAAPGRATDPLLSGASDSSAHRGCLWGSCRAILILFCCFMTSSRYDELEEAERRRHRQHAGSSGGVSAHFASYANAARSRRNQARDRHIHRHSTLVAAAAQQHQQAKLSGAGDEASQAAAAAALAAAQERQARAVALLGNSTSRDSDDEYDDETAALDAEEEEERRAAQRAGPCCERACFPRSCYGCCCPSYTRCCTVRRTLCLSVYSVLFAVLLLFLIYYCAVVRDQGWVWPPSRG